MVRKVKIGDKLLTLPGITEECVPDFAVGRVVTVVTVNTEGRISGFAHDLKFKVDGHAGTWWAFPKYFKRVRILNR